MFEDHAEFTQLAKSLSAIRNKSQSLWKSTSKSARRKASVLDQLLEHWDDAILHFNRLDQPTLQNEQLELEKLYLRAAFMLPLLRLPQATIDSLSTHRHKKTVVMRAGLWVGALLGGAAGGMMLGSPFLAIPGACVGHVAGSAAIKSERSLPETIKLVLHFGRAIAGSYKNPDAYSEAYRDFQSYVTTAREFVWVNEAEKGMLTGCPGKLYLYSNVNGDLLCQDADAIYELTPYLTKAETTERFASGFLIFTPNPLDKYRRIEPGVLQAAYIQAAIRQELSKFAPQQESAMAASSSVMSLA